MVIFANLFCFCYFHSMPSYMEHCFKSRKPTCHYLIHKSTVHTPLIYNLLLKFNIALLISTSKKNYTRILLNKLSKNISWKQKPNTNEVTMTHLAMKGLWTDIMILFSEYICSCCCVSTMCCFLRHFRAKVMVFSWVYCTSSTRPNPPTPRVAITSRSSNRM